jgi:hypothetical protein
VEVRPHPPGLLAGGEDAEGLEEAALDAGPAVGEPPQVGDEVGAAAEASRSGGARQRARGPARLAAVDLAADERSLGAREEALDPRAGGQRRADPLEIEGREGLADPPHGDLLERAHDLLDLGEVALGIGDGQRRRGRSAGLGGG